MMTCPASVCRLLLRERLFLPGPASPLLQPGSTSSFLPLHAEYSSAKFRAALLSMPPESCLKSVKEQQLSLVKAGAPARGPGAMLLFMQTRRPLQLLQLFTVQEAAQQLGFS